MGNSLQDYVNDGLVDFDPETRIVTVRGGKVANRWHSIIEALYEDGEITVDPENAMAIHYPGWIPRRELFRYFFGAYPRDLVEDDDLSTMGRKLLAKIDTVKV